MSCVLCIIVYDDEASNERVAATNQATLQLEAIETLFAYISQSAKVCMYSIVARAFCVHVSVRP